MVDGLVDLSAIDQNYAQVIVNICVIRLDFQRIAVLGDRLVDPSAAGQGDAKGVVDFASLGLISNAF